MSIQRIKPLLSYLKSHTGRNNKGHLTSYRKGGGFKRLYILYDNSRKVFNLPFMILKKRIYVYKSFWLDFICYSNGYFSYIRSTNKSQKGNILMNSDKMFQYIIGDKLPLKYLSSGAIIHCVENIPNKGSVFCRSKGTYAKVLGQFTHYCLLQFSSGHQRLVLNNCSAVIGVSEIDLNVKKLKCNAGANRKAGRRPSVRGIAKNPVDHPNGGRTKGGSAYRDTWGNLSLGVPTVKKKMKYIVLNKLKDFEKIL